MAYQRVNWQTGTKVSDGYVEIDGTRHPVTLPTYSGPTPCNPTSLNIMDEGIEENSKLLNGKMTVEEVTLDKVEFKNKFNKDTIIENSIIDLDGSVLSGYTNWCATDFIPIKSNTKYVYQGITNPGDEKYSAYYDSNKQFISEFEQESGFNKRITTPNGACYVRFSMLISDIDDFQLELGEWSTEYAPYRKFDDTFAILNLICPVGKVEVFFDNNDHSNYLGFTWERTSIGRVPVGIDENDEDFDTIGNTGGEKAHTLTINEMPSHKHDLTIIGGGSERASGVEWNTSNETRKYAGDMIEAVGGNQPHNIMQPYEVMAFWKRVS